MKPWKNWQERTLDSQPFDNPSGLDNQRSGNFKQIKDSPTIQTMFSEFHSLEPIQCAGKQIKPLIHPYSFPKMLVLNVRSLMNKMKEVELCLKNGLIDIACICESWSATEKYVAFHGYDTYFKQRMTPDEITVTHGGGVGIIC